MCRVDEHLRCADDGAPPWRRASFRPFVIALSMLALVDAALVVIAVWR